MKEYVTPMILANEELSEGVYAASGSADCWTVDAYSVQEFNNSHQVFEVHCVHSDTVEHISSASTVVLVFNYPVVDAYSEFDTSVSGNTVTIVRSLLADSYKSGDNVTYKVWVQASDEATTKALAVQGASISCTKSVNVQGKGGDGN